MFTKQCSQKWKAEQHKMESMSAASAQTFSYMNKTQPNTYRYAIDDRYRWAPVNEAANFYSVCLACAFILYSCFRQEDEKFHHQTLLLS